MVTDKLTPFKLTNQRKNAWQTVVFRYVFYVTGGRRVDGSPDRYCSPPGCLHPQIIPLSGDYLLIHFINSL